eukprot:1066989-Prorocentrum_minimum.AAC.1
MSYNTFCPRLADTNTYTTSYNTRILLFSFHPTYWPTLVSPRLREIRRSFRALAPAAVPKARARYT